MSILWAHDHKFYKYRERIFSKIDFPHSIWNRYLKFDSKLTVVSRLYNLENDDKDNLDKYNFSSKEQVDFVGINYSGSPLKYFTDVTLIKSEVKDLVRANDKIIVRLPSLIGTVVAFEALNQKKPLAVELVGDPWDTHINIPTMKSKLYAPIIYFQTKIVVAKADQVLYVTKHFLQGRYSNKSKYNINASNVEIKIKNKEPRELKKKNKFRIGLIGFLSPYKGIDTAIKAVKELNTNSEIEFSLEVLGTGSLDSFCELAKKLNVDQYISFNTLPAGEPVLNWLESIDLYIQPSLTEGLPRGLIEAMSMGLPAVGTNAGGIPELLPKSYIIKKGDYMDLNQKILYLCQNSKEYANLSKTNLETSKDYDNDFLDNKRENFYGNFILGDFNE
ncbi:glycosyltransferase [Salinicoccus albus]|uniref:glycosyltransferase n=1 Tax=Salinicoccus albus TaxID=418756 RepID=UPI00036BB985|nr:glycosyltransferase [Salinicoccus albus]